MDTLSQSVARYERQSLTGIPDLRATDTLFVSSDYSGEHQAAPYHTLGFLLADLGQSPAWDSGQREIRQRFASDGRRFSYKSLRDQRRSELLGRFLAAAGQIHGVLAVVLINRQIKNLFGLPSRQELRSGELSPLVNWNVRSAEKVLRVVHFLSFFLAGLCKPEQNIIWISDQDEIAANPARLSDLRKVFSSVADSYLGFDLGQVRVGTTKGDSRERLIEDLAAIPDLAAGALTHAFGEYQLRGGISRSGLVLPPPDTLQPKAREIMNWLSDEQMPLRPIVVMIERAHESGHVIGRLVHLEGNQVLF